jgi:hypothetical protein
MVPETSGLSQRDRFAIQSEDSLCAGCHAKFDPLGLPFETFGAHGELLREDSYGNVLTGEGYLTLGDIDAPYANAAEFSRLLAESDVVARCLVEKSMQHAFGRAMGAPDEALIEEVYRAFAERGRRYPELLVAIATAPDFVLVEVAP